MEYNLADVDTHNYERFVEKSWFIDQSIPQGLYCSNALGNEAGETQGVVKKLYRNGTPNYRRPDKLLFELGDTLYYLTKLAHVYGFSLEEVMYHNVKKIEARNAEKASLRLRNDRAEA